MNWLGYFLGKLFHWWLKADAVVKADPKINSTASVKQWLLRNRAALAVRFAIGTAVFHLWTLYPDVATTVLHVCASQLSSEGVMGTLRAAIEKASIPLNLATAWGFGYIIDSLLDKLCQKFPALRAYIPEVNGQSKAAGVP